MGVRDATEIGGEHGTEEEISHDQSFEEGRAVCRSIGHALQRCRHVRREDEARVQCTMIILCSLCNCMANSIRYNSGLVVKK